MSNLISRTFFTKDSFYCQSDIEGRKYCETQCGHCKEYYKPLEEDSAVDENAPFPTGIFLLRGLLSPLVFLWGCFLLSALTLFPLGVLVLISVFSLISMPFIWLFKKAGSNVEYPTPFLSDFSSTQTEIDIFVDHFLGATIHLWGAFYVAFHFVKTGEIYFPE